MIREFRLNGWRVQPQFHQLVGPGGAVEVEAHSMEVLVALARQAGEVVSRQDLLEEVWGESIVEEAALTHAIWDLRRALGDNPKEPEYIQTLPKRGYRLIAKVAWLDQGVGATERYRLLERVGGGGMGVVFKAEDTRLRRQVALKFLPPEWCRDSLAKERFLREARVAAALDHPNLCTLHEIDETQDGRLFLVMSLYDGETLKDRLARGRLPPSEILEIGSQVTQGLAALHRVGIVHRDIKPGNIMLPTNGPARILDFGLAKFAGGTQLTTTSTSPGTPAYMSPEQVRGEEVDARTDIWSLGVVLYEMLEGRPPFGKDDQSAVLFAILEREPPPAVGTDDPLSRSLRGIVRKALTKPRAERFANAGEMTQAFALLGLPVEGKGGKSRPAAGNATSTWVRMTTSWRRAARRQKRGAGPRLPALLGGIAAALVLAVAWLVWPEAQSREEALLAHSWQVTDLPGWEAHAAISPDGSMIAYASDQSGDSDIWLIDVEGGNAINLTNDPASDSEPAWFPDGSALAFTSDRDGRLGIWKVPRLGGPPTMLVADASDAAISRDGSQIAFAKEVPGDFARIGLAVLGDPESERLLTGPDDGAWNQMTPAFSPDGTIICYSDLYDLWLVPVGGGPANRLTTEAAGDLEPVWTSDGRHIYLSSHRAGTLALWRVKPNGEGLRRVTQGTGPERHPSLSHADDRLAYTTFTDDPDVVVVDRLTGEHSRLPGTRIEKSGVLTPEGDAIVFVSDRTRGYNLWLQPLDGIRARGEPVRLNDEVASSSNPAISPDGRLVAYQRREGADRAIWVLPLAGGVPRRLTGEGAGIEIHPAWSPDGMKLAFVHQDEGLSELRTLRVGGSRQGDTAETIATRATALFRPKWSPDGRTLAYLGMEKDAFEVWRTAVDGSAPPRRITDGAGAFFLQWELGSESLWVSGMWGLSVLSLRTVNPLSGRADAVEIPIGFGSWLGGGEFSLDGSGRLLAITRQETRGDVWIMGRPAA